MALIRNLLTTTRFVTVSDRSYGACMWLFSAAEGCNSSSWYGWVFIWPPLPASSIEVRDRTDIPMEPVLRSTQKPDVQLSGKVIVLLTPRRLPALREVHECL